MVTRETPIVDGLFPVPTWHPRFQYLLLTPGEEGKRRWCFRTADDMRGRFGWKAIEDLVGDERKDCAAVAEVAWRKKAEKADRSMKRYSRLLRKESAQTARWHRLWECYEERIDRHHEAMLAVQACREWGE